MKCPGCGEWFDMRDLGQMLADVHDAEIEISEGPGAANAQSQSDTGEEVLRVFDALPENAVSSVKSR
jgi:hypothetical protein